MNLEMCLLLSQHGHPSVMAAVTDHLSGDETVGGLRPYRPDLLHPNLDRVRDPPEACQNL